MKIAMALTVEDLIRTLRLAAHRIAERPAKPVVKPRPKPDAAKRSVR